MANFRHFAAAFVVSLVLATASGSPALVEDAGVPAPARRELIGIEDFLTGSLSDFGLLPVKGSLRQTTIPIETAPATARFRTEEGAKACDPDEVAKITCSNYCYNAKIEKCKSMGGVPTEHTKGNGVGWWTDVPNACVCAKKTYHEPDPSSTSGADAVAEPVVETPPEEKKYCADRCESPRERKDFALLTAKERTTYIKALTTLYEQGVYYTFVRIHQNGVSDPFAHQTSGFLPWHRRFLLEFEDALRCLPGDEFNCVTIPYWDWAEWQYFCNEGQDCESYDAIPKKMVEKLGAEVTNILTEYGGPGTAKDGCTKSSGCLWGSAGGGDADTDEVVGCVQDGPFSGWEDWDGHCLSRGVDWKFKDNLKGIKNHPFTTNDYLLNIMTSKKEYGSMYEDGYRSVLQNQPHNNQHNYLGGHMRSMRSPMDPIFFSHHAMIDKQWARWQDCHDYEDLDKEEMSEPQYEGNDAKAHIDMVMPFKLAKEPFKVTETLCSASAVKEAAESGTVNACQQCLNEQFKPSLNEYWCTQKWDQACTGFCSREQCQEDCGTGGGHRDATTDDFKLKDATPYEYEFDKRKLGLNVRDYLLATDKYGDASFTYEKDLFDTKIAEAVCHMQWEGDQAEDLERGALPIIRARFKQSAEAEAKGLWGVVKKALHKASKAPSTPGESGEAQKEKFRTVVRDIVKANAAKECKLQNEGNMCTGTQGEPCNARCPPRGTGIGEMENANTDVPQSCIFNLLFGTGDGSVYEKVVPSSACNDFEDMAETEEDSSAATSAGANYYANEEDHENKVTL